MPRGGPEKALPTMNGNWLGDGSSEDPQFDVEGKKNIDFVDAFLAPYCLYF